LRQGDAVIHAIGYGDLRADGEPIVTSVGAAPEPGVALGMASDYCEGPAGVWKAQTTRAGSDAGTGTPGADNDGVVVCAVASGSFQRGDANGDGGGDISDAIAVLTFLFAGGPMDCDDAADVDDDGQQNITDPIVLLTYLFLGGKAPSEPFGACGGDPTPDGLDCESSEACDQGHGL
jgi:hypothetical protein